MLSARYDVIVLGVGAMGSATVYQLARRGKRVLGLERYDIPHAMGSSHGHTRIIRLAYYEDPSYVMLLQRSYELWRSIQARAGERLLHITGSVDAGPSNSWVFKGSLQSCLQHELPHQVLTSKELAERFPGYRLPHETLAVLQPEGGFLLPERCIVAYVTAAQAEGAEVHGRERVLEWLPLGDGVRVITDHGVYETDHLVVTAGAWNAKLLPFLEGLAVPERQVLAWLQPQCPELFTPDRFPVFNLLVEEGRFYGLRFHLGVRVGGLVDEELAAGGRPLRRWGWNYRTLQGHLEMGQMDYEVRKWLDSGEVEFRIHVVSRPAHIPNPVIRLGFRLFGRRVQRRFARHACQRMARLTAARVRAGAAADHPPATSS